MHPPFGPILLQLGPLSFRCYGRIKVGAILITAWV